MIITFSIFFSSKITYFEQKCHFSFHVILLSLKRSGYFYKKTRRVFLLKSCQNLKVVQISEIELSKGLLIKSPFFYHCVFERIL